MGNAAPHATKRLPTGRTGSPALAGFGHGSMVVLDGGERLRLDDQVDFWPATGAWRNTDTGDTGQGPTTLFAHLAAQRAKAGQPVPEPVPLPSRRRVSCDYCGKAAGLIAGKEVYPHRPELAERHFWVCWPCDAWVGCFDRGDRDEPMGELADEALRDARRAAHAAFDPLWQQGALTRETAYEWLAGAMATPVMRCRIGRMSLADCRRVVELVADRDGRRT